ncbi:MAG: hypothetical protein GY779_03770 [Gammaproteobacteria bacterium]|nr:hypothetical protein [Gammaproteobacteria bacterium]
MQLYWATTEDHSEDWFIVASSANEAARLHENMEGFDVGDATAEAVLDIPEDMFAEAGWPPDELLQALGATFVSNGDARVVDICGRRFCEGLLEATLRSLDDDIFEARGQGRVNDTTKDSTH